ncbi:VTT domain-containing protein [Streptosporangium soli]|nr:VTT domain-containing protein [Streptosporangium sp. KLBMP 9127]
MVIPSPTDPSLFGLPLWVIAVVGAILLFGAFQVYYWVGRKLGDRLTSSRIGERAGRERIQKVENVVNRWGALAVYGCFWVPVLRHTLPWVAGALRVSYPWYVVASALGCLTWVPATMFVLYTVIWGWLEVAARSPFTALAAAVLAAVVAVLVLRRRRRRRENAAEDTFASV